MIHHAWHIIPELEKCLSSSKVYTSLLSLSEVSMVRLRPVWMTKHPPSVL